MGFLERVNDVLWDDRVLLAVLAIGILFTVWSRGCQWRAVTHGVAVLLGRYDRASDPGAISHFQALSTALSATVGLGNIAGVALAVSLGGPGAVFWLWVTGFVGMALKTTEVTQAMLHRNLDDPADPHGGAMWIASRGIAAKWPRCASLGRALAVVFCLTLLVSSLTGGNMFQAWNVADVTESYFGVPRLASGGVLTVLVGLVILGGIHRIGSVAGKLVPFMCLLYLAGALAVIVSRIDEVPGLLREIVVSAFRPSEAGGAFLGGTFGWVFLKGMQRALFSNEAGQGSSPIAHSAARTDEPVREGVVAGLEPFVDTLVVCTLTALVILLSGVWNRAPDLAYPEAAGAPGAVETAPGAWSLQPVDVPRGELDTTAGIQPVFAVVHADENPRTGNDLRRLPGTATPLAGGGFRIAWESIESERAIAAAGTGVYFDFKGATLTARAFDRVFGGLGRWIVPLAVWLFALSTIISWSYYGEQAIVYVLGARAVFAYRAVYCLLVLLSATPLIRTEHELDVVSTLGTGLMLWVNLPIMLLFGAQAMRAHREYFLRLDAGLLRGMKES